MECCWTTKENVVCGEPATVQYCLPLCDTHHTSTYMRWTRTIRQSAGVHGVEAFPGYCYVVLFPDETVKIGYSNTEPLLRQRLRKLEIEADKTGPGFTVLAVFAGGCAMEAVLHHRFWKSHIPGRGERFTFSEEIQDFLATAPRLCIPV